MGNPDGQLTTWTSRRGRFLLAMDTALDGMAVADLLALLMIVFDGLPSYVASCEVDFDGFIFFCGKQQLSVCLSIQGSYAVRTIRTVTTAVTRKN